MRTSLIVLLVIVQLHQAYNRPSQNQINIDQNNKHDITTHKPLQKPERRKKHFTLPLAQYLVPNLHVLPIQNMYSSPIQQNRTLFPIYSYIPVHHNYLVPVQDLAVIPLNREVLQKTPRVDDEENRFRSYYGGYGNGLSWGGRGAGHGFYVFGYAR